MDSGRLFHGQPAEEPGLRRPLAGDRHCGGFVPGVQMPDAPGGGAGHALFPLSAGGR